ncbi:MULTISPECIES: toxin glutamine deamidase domain-containing protein [unclassified Spirillospora]|uniref:toxin glutamine deamidase domain-containing protein n=1 Tax=unclassified Spirillospora TaxID=2642701 RepID=UPI003714AD2A
MGVEDTTKTDTRTETSDKPTSQERPSAPPPDNPGSPGQPSRLESLRRAREQQEARAQQAQEKDTGSSPREQRDDETTSEQPGRAAENAEASGRPGAKDKQQRQDEDQREDDPRIQDQGTSGSRETDTATPGDRNRDRPQAQPTEPRADTRTDTADRPASLEGQWTPPPDSPGSPGQPSRLESLARAREQQQAAAAQWNGRSDTGSRPTEQRVNESATPQRENDDGKAEPAGNAEGGGEGQDADAPTDDAKTEDGPKPDISEAPPVPDHAPQPTIETTGQPAGPQEARSGTTGELDPQKRTTDPPRTAEQGAQITDGLDNDAAQPGPEPAEQPTPLADGTDQERDAREPGRGEERRPDLHDEQPDTRDGDIRDGEPGNHRITDNFLPSPEPTGEAYGDSPESTDQATGRTDEETGRDDAREGVSEIASQRATGRELAEAAEKKINIEINETLNLVNPKFQPTKSAYSENCTGVVQANELRRRGSEVEAGPLERPLRKDEGGPGGRPLRDIEQVWGGKFTPGTKDQIEDALKEPGSRGIVYIAWNHGGAHVFNAENVGGKVRFVDGQPTPSVTDAANYFTLGRNTHYLRVDNRPTPTDRAIERFLEP